MTAYTSRIALVIAATKTCMDLINTAKYDNVPVMNIYEGQRDFEDDDTTRKLLCGYDPSTKVYGEIINAWFISSSKVIDVGKSIGRTGYNDWIITVDILGYLSADLTTNPSSEETFDCMCELVSDFIAQNIRTSLPASSFIETFVAFNKGFTVLDTMGGMVVHRAEGSFTINLCHQRGPG